MAPGEDIGQTVARKLLRCRMAVILGTTTYGKETSIKFSTAQELRCIIDHDKPFFLVKMCDKFSEDIANFHLPPSISCYRWQPDQDAAIDVPPDLVERIVRKLAQTRSGAASPPVAASSAVEAAVSPATEPPVAPVTRATSTEPATSPANGVLPSTSAESHTAPVRASIALLSLFGPQRLELRTLHL